MWGWGEDGKEPQWSGLLQKGHLPIPAVQISTEFTRVFSTLGLNVRGCCVGAVRVGVCVHIHVMVSMAAADRALGTLRGPPWSGTWTVPPLPSPPAPGLPQPGPLLPASSSASGGAGPETLPGAQLPFLPESMSQGGERPQLPFAGEGEGVHAGGLGCCHLLPSPGTEGEGSSSGGQGPGFAASPCSVPWSPPSPSPCPVQHCEGPSVLDQALLLVGRRLPGGGPRPIPPVPRICAMTLGKSFLELLASVASVETRTQGRA